MALRKRLEHSTVEVIELAPPLVQTTLTGERQASDPNGMPLAEFIGETMDLLQGNPTAEEILVERVGFLRNAEREGRFAEAFTMVNAH